MVFGTKQFRPYLLHSHCQWVALTDHAPLAHWGTPGTSLTLRQIRHLDHLSQLNFKWQHLPGKKMVFADLLSRPPGCEIEYALVQPTLIKNNCDICANACGHDAGARIAAALNTLATTTTPITTATTTATTTTSFVNGIDGIGVADIALHYNRDPYTAKILAALAAPASKQTHFRGRYQQLENGLILVRNLVDGGEPRILLPAVAAVTEPIFGLFHDSPSCGHTVAGSTYKRARRRFFAQGLFHLVERYVARCDICRQNRVRQHARVGMAQPLEIPLTPGSSLSTDFAFSLPPSVCAATGVTYRGFQVYVCRLSKRVMILPCNESITAEQAAALYTQRVLPVFGMMTSLVSDRDPRFTSTMWKELASLLKVKLKMSTARNPQTDGQSEQTIRWVKEILRALCESQSSWVNMLPFVELVINTTPTGSRSSTTPMQIFQGHDPILPQDLFSTVALEAVGAGARNRAEFQQQAMLAARGAIQTAQDHAAAGYNKGRSDITFKVGDWARVKKNFLVPATERGPETRLTLRRPWPGPFKIARQIGANAFELGLPRGAYPRTHRVINVAALAPETATRSTDLAAGGQVPTPGSTGTGTWAVDRIVGHRIRHRRHEYAARWPGTSAGHDQWQQTSSFQDGAATTQALLDFEQRRLGDNRHVDAAAPAVSYPTGPTGTEVAHSGGWRLYFAHNNDTLFKIGRKLALDPKLLQDFNLSLYDGLAIKARLSTGTAIRIRSPATPGG